MPRAAKITIEDVLRYVSEIRAEGGTPTARALLQRHGVGSMTTIQRLLHQVLEAEASASSGVGGVMPEGLLKAFGDFVRNEVARGKEVLEKQVRLLEADAAESAETIDRQNELAAELEQRGKALETANASTEGRAAHLAAEVDAARRQVEDQRSVADQLRAELAVAQARLADKERLEAELADIHRQLRECQGLREEADRALAVARAEKAALEVARDETARIWQERLNDVRGLRASRRPTAFVVPSYPRG